MAGNREHIIWADGKPKGEKSGGPTSYYLVDVVRPNQGEVPYQAECGDIIEALGMTFNEGCAFKALWRTAAARTLGKLKEGGDALYDAQKVQFYGGRMVAQLQPPMVDSGTLGKALNVDHDYSPMKREDNGNPFTGIERMGDPQKEDSFLTYFYVNGWEVTETNFWAFMDTLDDNDVRKMRRHVPGYPSTVDVQRTSQKK
jgi:hypothetical protein